MGISKHSQLILDNGPMKIFSISGVGIRHSNAKEVMDLATDFTSSQRLIQNGSKT
jgi:hypothetical protein